VRGISILHSAGLEICQAICMAVDLCECGGFGMCMAGSATLAAYAALWRRGQVVRHGVLYGPVKRR